MLYETCRLHSCANRKEAFIEELRRSLGRREVLNVGHCTVVKERQAQSQELQRLPLERDLVKQDQQ